MSLQGLLNSLSTPLLSTGPSDGTPGQAYSLLNTPAVTFSLSKPYSELAFPVPFCPLHIEGFQKGVLLLCQLDTILIHSIWSFIPVCSPTAPTWSSRFGGFRGNVKCETVVTRTTGPKTIDYYFVEEIHCGCCEYA